MVTASLISHLSSSSYHQNLDPDPMSVYDQGLPGGLLPADADAGLPVCAVGLDRGGVPLCLGEGGLLLWVLLDGA
jgi:hypothetical protein